MHQLNLTSIRLEHSNNYPCVLLYHTLESGHRFYASATAEKSNATLRIRLRCIIEHDDDPIETLRNIQIPSFVEQRTLKNVISTITHDMLHEYLHAFLLEHKVELLLTGFILTGSYTYNDQACTFDQGLQNTLASIGSFVLPQNFENN